MQGERSKEISQQNKLPVLIVIVIEDFSPFALCGWDASWTAYNDDDDDDSILIMTLI